MAQSNPTNVVRFLHIIENLKVKKKNSNKSILHTFNSLLSRKPREQVG